MKNEHITVCHVIDRYLEWNETFAVITRKRGAIQVLFNGTLMDWIGTSVANKYEMKQIKSFRQKQNHIPIVEV